MLIWLWKQVWSDRVRVHVLVLISETMMLRALAVLVIRVVGRGRPRDRGWGRAAVATGNLYAEESEGHVAGSREAFPRERAAHLARGRERRRRVSLLQLWVGHEHPA